MPLSEGESDSNGLLMMIIVNLFVFIITILCFSAYRLRKGDHENFYKKLNKEENILI